MDKVSAWRTADGELFLDEQAAKDHDFEIAIEAWIEARFPTTETDRASAPYPHRSFDNLLSALKDDRTKMLAVFKLLNGGNGPVAPPPSIDYAGLQDHAIAGSGIQMPVLKL